MTIARVAWTRGQLLQALALYCQLPFGKLHSLNPAIIQLAAVLGRTPSALAMKLNNFASLDPTLRRRGVRGMANASSLDRAVWAEYRGRWSAIADALPTQVIAEVARLGLRPRGTRKAGPTEATRPTRQRVGQGFFRNAVLASYEYRCCITGLSSPELLRASHIIPWAEREDTRLNPANGLCLNVLHDAAFDNLLLTLDRDRRVKFSARLSRGVPADVFSGFFAPYEGRRIREAEKFSPAEEFLEYHRQKAFKMERDQR